MIDSPTVKQFRRLALSSPWRWQAVEFEWTLGAGYPWRHAWIRRPGDLRVENAAGELVASQIASRPFAGQKFKRNNGPWQQVQGHWPTQACPSLDDDGLVIALPDDAGIDYDAPFFENYHWVAMLAPFELSWRSFGGDPDDDSLVDLSGVDVVDHHGRTAWQVTAQSTSDYNPRCPCCALLPGEFDYDAQEWIPGPPAVVRLDSATGLCVFIETQMPDPVVDLDMRILDVDSTAGSDSRT